MLPAVRNAARLAAMTLKPLPFVPLEYHRLAPETMLTEGRRLREVLGRRRSVREFSPEPPPRACVELAIATASTAPSGANRQPWRFVVVDDPALKREIRGAAEREERENYEHRFPPEWLEALAPLGTDWRKGFLETAPYLVVVFRQLYEVRPDGSRLNNYYVNESVGLACGLFIVALHTMGLVTLTHTPNPMGFLSELLGRPASEKPYILFPVGYPAPDAKVPNLSRKPLGEVMQWNRG
jgi:nitroreductase